jgi:hypothetical protein
MRGELQRVFSMNNFFKYLKAADDNIEYNFKLPSILLINNVYSSWLQSVFSKTHKSMTIYTQRKHCLYNGKAPSLPYGYLNNNIINYNETILIEHQIEALKPKTSSQISLNVFVPKQDSMQYFIQWQRYRKYWWSSVSCK